MKGSSLLFHTMQHPGNHMSHSAYLLQNLLMDNQLRFQQVSPEELSYDKIIADASSLSRYDLNRQERVKICPSPFFKISIRSTGQIMICCPYNGLELSSMNVNTNTLLECWNSEEHKKVLFNILAEKYEGITAKCKKCSLRDDFAFSEDILDNYGKEIYERICSL